MRVDELGEGPRRLAQATLVRRSTERESFTMKYGLPKGVELDVEVYTPRRSRP